MNPNYVLNGIYLMRRMLTENDEIPNLRLRQPTRHSHEVQGPASSWRGSVMRIHEDTAFVR